MSRSTRAVPGSIYEQVGPPGAGLAYWTFCGMKAKTTMRQSRLGVGGRVFRAAGCEGVRLSKRRGSKKGGKERPQMDSWKGGPLGKGLGRGREVGLARAVQWEESHTPTRGLGS